MKEKLKQLHYGNAALLAVCTVAFFTLSVPLQTYFANSDIFEFGMGGVLREALPWFIACTVGLFAVLTLSELVLGRLLFVFVLAALVCEWLEVGFFSIGLPPFNAAPRLFDNPFRQVIDTVLLLFFATAIVSAYRWTKLYAHWIALAIVVLTVCSFFDVRKTSNDITGGGWQRVVVPTWMF